jgi:hypothetical protein
MDRIITLNEELDQSEKGIANMISSTGRHTGFSSMVCRRQAYWM